MFEFSQVMLTADMADMASMEYKRRQWFPAMFLESRRILSGPNFQNFFFWGAKFSQIFSPLRSVGFCLPLGPVSGCDSRGRTPLILAAEKGHVSAVERLLEAKAAVDAEDKRGRGLGKPLEAMGSFWRSGRDVALFVESVLPKHLALIFCIVLCDRDYIVATPWVGLSLKRSMISVWKFSGMSIKIHQNPTCSEFAERPFECDIIITWFDQHVQVSWFEPKFFHFICEFGQLHDRILWNAFCRDCILCWPSHWQILF